MPNCLDGVTFHWCSHCYTSEYHSLFSPVCYPAWIQGEHQRLHREFAGCSDKPEGHDCLYGPPCCQDKQLMMLHSSHQRDMVDLQYCYVHSDLLHTRPGTTQRSTHLPPSSEVYSCTCSGCSISAASGRAVRGGNMWSEEQLWSVWDLTSTQRGQRSFNISKSPEKKPIWQLGSQHCTMVNISLITFYCQSSLDHIFYCTML